MNGGSPREGRRIAMLTVALCMGGCLYLRKDAEGSLRNLRSTGCSTFMGLLSDILVFALQLSTLRAALSCIRRPASQRSSQRRAALRIPAACRSPHSPTMTTIGAWSEALYNWRNVLFDLSLLKPFEAPEVMTLSGERLLRRAIEKYKSALTLNSDFSEAHNNLANALTDLSRHGSLSDRLDLLKKALPHYSRAAVKPENPHVVYCNWGKALRDLARIANSKPAFMQSFEKFKISSEVNPQHYSTFLSWGNAFSDLARRSKSARMFDEAFAKYRRAAEIDRNDTAAYFNLLNDVTHVTDLLTRSKKRALLLEAAATRRRLDRRRKKLLQPNVNVEPSAP
jgi:tetratricopeptide (TPR) repeat protein